MRRISLLILGLTIGLTITGFFFSSVSRSGEQGDFFYTCLKTGDYEKVIALFDNEVLALHSKDYWLQEFNSRNKTKGALCHTKILDFILNQLMVKA